jgi:hypothetical protein
VRRLAAYLFIDYRGWTEYATAIALLAGFAVAISKGNYDETLTRDVRGSLYASIAGSTAALLGFVLAALAILVALPSSARLGALREHPKWERVPSAFFRASRALLAALILATLGIPLDSATNPWWPYEAAVIVSLVFSISRVVASVVALDQVVFLAQSTPEAPSRIDDPGP